MGQVVPDLCCVIIILLLFIIIIIIIIIIMIIIIVIIIIIRVVRVRRIRISKRIRKGKTTPYWNMYAIVKMSITSIDIQQRCKIN